MIIENFLTFLNKVMFFSSYVANTTSFEKPLSAEEEMENILLAKEGNEAAKEKLIKHNLRLVAHIVKKYRNAGEADDLISVGSIGLIKAINSYELGKGSQLSTYAARCIENEILMLIRSTKKHKMVISLNDSIGKDKDGNELSLKDIISDEEDSTFKQVQTKSVVTKLQKLIAENLTKREQVIINMRYGLNDTPALTQREIALKLGISRSYISRLEKKAIDLIKDKIDIEEFI